MTTSTPGGYTLYHATLVHTPKLGSIEVLPSMLMGVESSGKISFLTKYGSHERSQHGSAVDFFKSQADATVLDQHFQFVDLSHDPCTFLFPGFVDTHIHASQYPNVGIGCELPLLEWLKDYTFSLESRFMASADKNDEFARDVYSKVIAKTLANGTTCASYFTTIDTDTSKLFADLLVERGQRGFVGKVCMDHNPTFPGYEEPYEECVDGMSSIINHCKDLDKRVRSKNGPAMVKPIVTPRFAPVCSRKLMSKLGALAEAHEIPVQTHISENKDEIELVKELFPECDSYAGVYDNHGLLGRSTILAHAVHLDATERKLVSERQCSISHCPSSNTFITSGEAPVKQYLYEDKINVSLGTDLSGGYEQSILGVARSSIMVSHHLAMDTKAEVDQRLTVAEALYMATMGGARAVNMGESVGSFEKGKYFDAQLVSISSQNSNIDVFEYQKPVIGEKDYEHKMLQLVQRWVFSGDDRNCMKVWCNGRKVVDKADSWVYVQH